VRAKPLAQQSFSIDEPSPRCGEVYYIVNKRFSKRTKSGNWLLRIGEMVASQ
jgi:hypothetical protein